MTSGSRRKASTLSAVINLKTSFGILAAGEDD